MTRARVLLLLLLCGGASQAIHAQAPADGLPQPLTLDAAIQFAADHYPTVRAALEQVHASEARVDVARSEYLPRLDALWQSNRATANNVFGQVLPQSVIPALTGPVLASPSRQSVWGSATGALFSWEPFDFGLRHADVENARAAVTQARASDTLTRLDVQTAVADAFLALVAAQEAVTAAQQDRDRRDVLLRSVQTLVTNQLRPGADASRADAERAAAQTRLLQATRVAIVASSRLARVLGLTARSIQVAADSLLDRVPSGDVPPGSPAAHPLAQVRQAAVTQARATETVLARTDLPRVLVQSSVFARGSGASASGLLDASADGLALDRANWAAGVQVLFPNLFDFASLRSRKAAAAASERASAALYDEALLAVSDEQQAATALLDAARAIATNTPVQLAAARQSETQARARYDAGLATLVEVADAQGLLTQAEAQDRVARIDVWRALLATAAAHGDLAPFRAALQP